MQTKYFQLSYAQLNKTESRIERYQSCSCSKVSMKQVTLPPRYHLQVLVRRCNLPFEVIFNALKSSSRCSYMQTTHPSSWSHILADVKKKKPKFHQKSFQQHNIQNQYRFYFLKSVFSQVQSSRRYKENLNMPTLHQQAATHVALFYNTFTPLSLELNLAHLPFVPLLLIVFKLFCFINF